MTFTDAIKTCFNKYADFSGRATRSEYWWFQLFFILVYLALGVLSGAISEMFAMLAIVFALGVFIPALAAGVRRLHDTDKSGWWLLLGFVPLIGLLLIYFLAIAGTSGDNQFGPEPTN
jgi:uncharacterized membrane protein YhaH (DUF805 family)